MTGSGNGLLHAERQPIKWTNYGILSIRASETNFNQNTSFFFEENVLENLVCKNGNHFAQAPVLKGTVYKSMA